MNTDNSYKLIFTKQFLQELENIEAYLYERWYYFKASKMIMNMIDDALIQTCMFPKSHQRIQNTKYRRILVKNYIIIYRTNEKRKEVYIVHIFYSKSNYLEKL